MTTTPAVNETFQKNYDCISEAACNIFSVSCGATLAPVSSESVSSGELVIAIISLVGDLEWSVFIGLPKATACAVSAKFAGFEIPYESSDMGDAVGELANIIAGDIKARLDARGVKADISLPTVLRAQDIHMLIQRHATSFKVCFQCDLGTLWLGVIDGKGGGFAI